MGFVVPFSWIGRPKREIAGKLSTDIRSGCFQKIGAGLGNIERMEQVVRENVSRRRFQSDA